MAFALLCDEHSTYTKESNVIINVPIIEEWYRWLSYTPDFYLARINELRSKKAGDLSTSELKELDNYWYQRKMLCIVEKYRNQENLTDDEAFALDVLIYNHHIYDDMLTKLDENERRMIDYKSHLIYYSSVEDLEEELPVLIDLNCYNKLKPFDAYMLNLMCSNQIIREEMIFLYNKKKIDEQAINSQSNHRSLVNIFRDCIRK